MKTLFANGCSWTYGGGLDIKITSDFFLKKTVWPEHLKNLMNYDRAVNLAAGCGSNQRIFRTTLDWILKQEPETLKNTTAVIQFTQWSRKEFYFPSEIETEYLQDNEYKRWAKLNIHGSVIEHNISNALGITDQAKIQLYQDMLEFNHTATYKMYTEIEGLYSYLSYCAAMANLFEKYEIEYYFWDFLNITPDIPEPFLQHLLSSYPWLERDSIRHQWPYQRLRDLAPDHPYYVGQDNHPSVLGHKQIAEHIFKAISNIRQGKV